MSDQCKNCTMRGDYNGCTSTPCGHHENWINQTRIGRIKELEFALQEIADLPSVRQDECANYSLNILAQLPPKV